MSKPSIEQTNDYDADFYGWIQDQAAKLKAGQLNALDVANLAEEIESMGRSEKRSLISHFTVLYLHLLKWQYQSERRGNSWRFSIANARGDIEDILADSPSLKPALPDLIGRAYRRARLEASGETGIFIENFPDQCPWSIDQSLDSAFLPNE